MRIALFLYFFLLALTHSLGQTTEEDTIVPPFTLESYLVIDTIHISGAKKTKHYCILRELEFQKGDSVRIKDLSALFRRNKLRLMNTGLFTSATINILEFNDKNKLSVKVDLVESWYIYPIPTFALADRNFNVWWRDQNHSLRRLNYGLDLFHFNLSGNNDLFKISAQGGYTQKLALEYNRPWVNRKQTIGFRSKLSYSRSREVNLRTFENKQVFYFDPNQFLRKHWLASVELNYRPALFHTHRMFLQWQSNTVQDTIANTLNPDYFIDNKRKQQYASIGYYYEHDVRDIRPYPLTGHYLRIGLIQNGILPKSSLFLTQLLPRFDIYFKLSKKWSLELKSQGRLSLPRKKPPFQNNQALGYYGYTVRGFEYYVSDGLDYGMGQSSLRYEFFDRIFHLGKYMPISAFKNFPLKLYFSINNDVGYANDPYYSANNPLSNRLLYGYGVSLDIVAYYDKIAKIQYSRNDFGEGGVFLYINSAF